MFYVECDESNLNMASGAVTDISGKCGRHATPAQCNRVPFVRRRCQKSCKVCVGGKFERNFRLLMIFLFFSKANVKECIFILSCFIISSNPIWIVNTHMQTTIGNGMFLYLYKALISTMSILNKMFIISIATVFSFYILLVCQDISTMCKAFATPKNCANNGRVQRRCQKSCKRCRKYM